MLPSLKKKTSPEKIKDKIILFQLQTSCVQSLYLNDYLFWSWKLSHDFILKRCLGELRVKDVFEVSLISILK